MASLPEKVRQQFDFGPYPRIPIDSDPCPETQLLFRHNWVTPYYLHYHHVANPATATILDAGCGTGYRTLALALANPGAQVFGVDLSERSVALARSRLDYHGRRDVQVHALDIQDLPTLGLQFDYINCDDTLYLFQDPAAGLTLLKRVLKPGGIIRANLHSALQREAAYRGQAVFRQLGLFNENPETDAVETVQSLIGGLKPWVNLKRQTWKPQFAQADATADILMNYLFQGDQGYTIPQMFAALDAADLQFIRMVNWQQWRLPDLFDQLPPPLHQRLMELPQSQQLQLFELMHPVHRLLDFWCVNAQVNAPTSAVAQWDALTWAKQWSQVSVYLHPQLRTKIFRQACLNSWRTHKPLILTAHLDPGVNTPVALDSRVAIILLMLVDTSPQPLLNLIKRSMDLFPRDPDTLETVTPEAVLAELKHVLVALEAGVFVMFETRSFDS
ncbi:MAG: class I SAM-dependent methyltransferase [Leptolyngbya sp. DLM2.Bin15]|nr:MAG: class I SAM-dependent methyltransferase [Leptolyngbya sp. DLM2.Bin15]